MTHLKQQKITWFGYSSTPLGYMTSITSTAQWSTRINQVIFAVLDVS